MDQPSEVHTEQGILKTVEAAGDVTVERALVGVVNGRDVSITQAGAGPVAAQGDVRIQQGGCGPVLVGGDLRIHQGGCGPAMVRGNLSIQQGGTQSVLVGRQRDGRPGSVRRARSRPRRSPLEEGSRVLIGTPGAFAARARPSVRWSRWWRDAAGVRARRSRPRPDAARAPAASARRRAARAAGAPRTPSG
mgnify:CR=1 FL=1